MHVYVTVTYNTIRLLDTSANCKHADSVPCIAPEYWDMRLNGYGTNDAHNSSECMLTVF